MKYLEAIILGAIVWMVAPALWAAAPSGQYTDLENGTVKDNKTGLVWQQQVSASRHVWSCDSQPCTDAKTYCDQLSLGGSASGWRLPTKLELESLVDYRIAPPGPAVDSTAFPSTPSAGFWTSTPHAGTSAGWYVRFDAGYSFFSGGSALFWVRCVR